MKTDLRRLAARYEARYAPRGGPRLLKPRRRLIKRLPLTHNAAKEHLREPDTVRSIAFRRAVTAFKFEGIHPELLDWIKAFQQALHGENIPMVLSCLNQTWQQQAFDHVRFLTEPPEHGPHAYGCAVQFRHYSRGLNLLNREWEVLDAIGREVARKRHAGIYWCGLDAPYNPSRWQLFGWESRVTEVP